MSSTLLFGLNQPQVKARLWSAAFANGAPPSEYGSGAWDERFSGPEGSIGFQTVPDGGFVVYFSKDGYQPQQYPLDGTGTAPQNGAIEVRLVPQAPVLLRWRVQDRHFVTDAGRVKVKMADCFQGPDRFEAGEDLGPVFAQLQAKGFNAIRVFGSDKAIPEQLGRPPYRANPARVRDFCRLASAYGLYVYWVVFCDGVVPPSEQLAYFAAIVEALKQEPNTILSLVNEYTEHENWVDRNLFQRPSGIACDSGSAGMDQATSPPHWDFDVFHPRRDQPNSIKDCCVVDEPNYINLGLAVLVDEPDRFGSDGNPDANYCALQAGASVESAMGICFHSKRGVYAQVMDADTERCADAFLRALS